MDVCKKGLILLLVLFSTAVKAEKVSQEVVELVQQETFIYPKEVYTAYILNEKNGKATVKVENSKAIIKAHSGKVVVQALLKEGGVVNLAINTSRKPRPPLTLFHNKDKQFSGYYFRWKNSYVDSWNHGKSVSPTHFGSHLSFGTKVGPNNFFSMELNYREQFDLLYYLKWKHKKSYIAHGDKTPPKIPTLPRSFQIPRMRQYSIGYEDNFFFDLWTAQFSPIGKNFSGERFLSGSSNAEQTSYQNQQKDWYTGTQLGYKTDNWGLYAMAWKNPKNEDPIAFLGVKKLFFNKTVNFSAAVNPSNSFPQGYANIFYNRNNNKDRESWALQRASLYYEIAPKGQQQLLIDSLLPREELILNSSFYNLNRNMDKGSMFLDLQYNYLLNGPTVTHSPFMNLGWGNSHFEVFSGYGITKSQTKFLQQESHLTRISPGIEFFLRPKNDIANYSIRVTQLFNDQKDGLNNNFKNQETIWAIKAYNKKWKGELALGRVYNENSSFKRAAFRVNPSFGYNGPKFKASAFVNFLYNEEGYSQYNSERAGINLGWSPNQNHLFEIRGSQIKDSQDRDSQRIYVGYTLKFGDNNKSVIQAFDSKKVKFIFFEDLDFNQSKEENEKGFEGIKVSISNTIDKKEDSSNSSGELVLSGLTPEHYTLSIDPTSLPSGYMTTGIPYSLDFSKEDYLEIKVPVIKVKKKIIALKSLDEISKEEESFSVSVVCQQKKTTNYIVIANEHQEIIFPEKDKCELVVNLIQSDFSVAKNNLPLVNENLEEIFVKKQDHILGQIFWDKNNNNAYDFGEELVSAKIIFSNGKEIISDNNGTWLYKKANKINNLSFLRAEKSGFSCLPKFNKKIKNNSKKEVFLIFCQKL